MASHQRQQQPPQQHGHPRVNAQQPPFNNAIRTPNLNGGQNGSNDPNTAENGNGDLYQQLIDSNDLVKELDDIEAISQQISQHAEVLYQSWKQQEANKQQQQHNGQPNNTYNNYKQINNSSHTLPSNPNKSNSVQSHHLAAPSSTGSLPRLGYQPGDFTKRATSPLKVHENGKANGGVGGTLVPFHKQNGNHNSDTRMMMPNDRRIHSSTPPTLNDTSSDVVYNEKIQSSAVNNSLHRSTSLEAGSSNQPPYQNIKRQTSMSNNGIISSNNTNPLSTSTSGLASPSFISSASNAAAQRSNTLPVSARSTSAATSGQPLNSQPTPPVANRLSGTPNRSATLSTGSITSSNSSNPTSSSLLSEENSKSSEPAVGRSLELLATPEVNGNLKDLVNSFVSTDRAKQAARQTISNTINSMSRRNGNGIIRSTSPSNTASSSSPFSSRGVSPLRSPMLAAATSNPSPQSVMNSLHAISSPSPLSTPSVSSLSSINTNLHHPASLNPHSSGPLSPSASSTSSTTSSIDSQMNRSISTTSSTDPTSNVHTKLNPMFSRTPSNMLSSSSSNNPQKLVGSPTSPTAASAWPSDQNTIPIPVQHIRTNEAGKPTSSSTLMMVGAVGHNKGSSNNLRSPRVLQNMTSSTNNVPSSSAPSPQIGSANNHNPKQLQPPIRQTSLEFNLQPPNLSSLHDQHIDSMRHKFEEAKQRMNLLHQRVRSGSDTNLLSSSRPTGGGLNMRSPFDAGDPFDVDAVDGGFDDPSNHSSYLFDQFRRRVARSKRETPSAPHPELTPQQRQHIFERTSSTSSLLPGGAASVLNAASAPNRRFAGGSVADRVLMFERSPFAMDGRSLSAGNLLEKKKESNVPNWKSNQGNTHAVLDAQQKAQVSSLTVSILVRLHIIIMKSGCSNYL